MIYLTRGYHFSASHRLYSDSFSEAENRRIYGKCANPHGHGHNYRLEVTVAGPIDAKTGMVMDLLALDQIVEREVLERFDHQNLNALGDFSAQVPTSEMLCQAIYERLRANFPLARLERVRLQETSLNAFEYPATRAVR